LNLIRVMPAKGQDAMPKHLSELSTGIVVVATTPTGAIVDPDTHDLRAGALR
jgi:hypothetical protein